MMNKSCWIRYILAATITAGIGGNMVWAYEDTTPQSWWFTATEYLTQAEVLNGEKTNFEPQKNLSRSAALKLILVATNENLDSAATHPFTDVADDAWFAPFVRYGVEKNILSTSGKTEFFPASEVTKAAYIKMMVEAFGIDFSAFDLDAITFADVPAGHWAENYLKFAVKFNVTKVDEEGNIFPNKVLSRAEAAQLLFNLLKKGKGLKPQTLLQVIEQRLILAINALENGELFAASTNVSVAKQFAGLAIDLVENVPGEQNKNILRAAEKTTDAMMNLIGAHTAAQNGLVEDIIVASKQAWTAADESETLNPGQAELVSEIKKLSETMANKARAEKTIQEGSEE